jgi:hypothetical protein
MRDCFDDRSCGDPHLGLWERIVAVIHESLEVPPMGLGNGNVPEVAFLSHLNECLDAFHLEGEAIFKDGSARAQRDRAGESAWKGSNNSRSIRTHL